MNSRERVLTAIAHRTPDRVPITFDAEKEVIAALQQHFGSACMPRLGNATDRGQGHRRGPIDIEWKRLRAGLSVQQRCNQF